MNTEPFMNLLGAFIMAALGDEEQQIHLQSMLWSLSCENKLPQSSSTCFSKLKLPLPSLTCYFGEDGFINIGQHICRRLKINAMCCQLPQ